MTNTNHITNEVIAYYHKIGPIKARIQVTIDFLEKKRIKSFNKDAFLSNGVFYVADYRILKSSNLYTLKNDLMRKETRAHQELKLTTIFVDSSLGAKSGSPFLFAPGLHLWDNRPTTAMPVLEHHPRQVSLLKSLQFEHWSHENETFSLAR